MSPTRTVSLRVGARHACFACRVRDSREGRCPRCDRPRVDLASPDGARSLARLGRANARADLRRREGANARHPAWTLAAHATALASSAAVALFGSHLRTGGYVGHGLVALIGAVLGLIGGYVLAAVVPVIVLVLAMALAVGVSSAVLLVALAALPATFALGREKGRRARAALGRGVGRIADGALAPVRALRGRVVFGRGEADGLEPAEGDGSEPIDGPVFEGSLDASSGEVSLGGLTGAVLGARGVTRGATVRDARVGSPLVVRTADGERVRVELGAGSVRVDARGALEVQLGDDALVEWGVPARPSTARERRGFPADRALEVFAVRVGDAVRVEGGVLGDEAVMESETASYREAERVRVVRGTAERPVRLTVLSAIE